MTDSPFASPSSSGDGLNKDKLLELNGALLIIEPSEHVENITTSFGVSDAAKATITVVDGKNAGEVIVDTLIFPKILKSNALAALKKNQPLLGRLSQGVAKPGQSKPWILAEPTPDDLKAAMAVWEARIPF